MSSESPPSPVTIRTLGANDSLAATGLLAHLNPDCSTAVLRQRYETILADHPHFRSIGAYIDGDLAGLAGIWIATKIWCGRYLEIDNLVVHPLHRDQGVATALFARLDELAKTEDCNLIVLDSYTSNHASHRLYHRLGYEIWGFHFVKPLADLNL